jgi:hypothetical protein
MLVGASSSLRCWQRASAAPATQRATHKASPTKGQNAILAGWSREWPDEQVASRWQLWGNWTAWRQQATVKVVMAKRNHGDPKNQANFQVFKDSVLRDKYTKLWSEFQLSKALLSIKIVEVQKKFSAAPYWPLWTTVTVGDIELTDTSIFGTRQTLLNRIGIAYKMNRWPRVVIFVYSSPRLGSRLYPTALHMTATGYLLDSCAVPPPTPHSPCCSTPLP